MVDAEHSTFTGDLPSTLGSETHATPDPVSSLRTEKPLDTLPSRPTRVTGVRKIIAGATTFAAVATGAGALSSPDSAFASDGRKIYAPGAGETIKDSNTIYCTPEYIAQNPQLIAGGDSNVGGEPTSSTEGAIAEVSGVDTFPIQQPENGTQRVIINFTDDEGRALQILVPQCPPTGEQTGNQTKNNIEQIIQHYTQPNENGDYIKIPIEEKFTDANNYSGLNILPVNEADLYGYADVFFQGYALTWDVVTPRDSKPHLIVYMLQEKPYGKGDQYVIPVNVGEVNKKDVVSFKRSSQFPLQGNFDFMSVKDFIDVLDSDGPCVGGFGINAGDLPEGVLPKKYDQFISEQKAQREVAKELIAYSYKINILKEQDAALTPLLEKVINRVFKDGDDLSEIPVMSSFVVKK